MNQTACSLLLLYLALLLNLVLSFERIGRPPVFSSGIIPSDQIGEEGRFLPAAICSLANTADQTTGTKKAFIFGLGYVGLRLARFLKSQGWQVAGTCTNVNLALEHRNEGIQTYLFDEITVKRGQLEAMEDIMEASFILSTIPPIETMGRSTDLVLDAHGDDLRRAALSSNLRWIGYLSSTGVYGDCHGAWVEESHPLNPDNAKTKARAEAEARWKGLHSRSGLPVHIFRLAGIYGPHRSALDSLLKSKEEEGMGSEVVVDDVTFVSRVHVDDIVRILYASMNHATPGEVYNVADDLPSTRFDVLSYASRLLACPPLRPGGEPRSRSGSKRVDNTKVKNFLHQQGLSLVYPDYRSGLEAVAKVIQAEAAKAAASRRRQQQPSDSHSLGEDIHDASSHDLPAVVEERIQSLERRLSKVEEMQEDILVSCSTNFHHN
eukprot:gene247-265_t